MCMVDLPGYGFAYAKEEVKEAWEELVSTQLALTFLGFACVVFIGTTKMLGFFVLVLNMLPL